MTASEGAIQEALQRRELDLATSLTLRAFGAEVFGFLVAIHKDSDVADDAFALLAERLWKSLATFEGKCSMRTWVYKLARNASTDVLRAGARANKGRQATLSESGNVPELVARIRTETLSILRTARRTALDDLCQTLPREDQELLTLRLSRELPWRDIAIVLGGLDAAAPEAALIQESARLRKRYQLLRTRLRAQGKERGLL